VARVLLNMAGGWVCARLSGTGLVDLGRLGRTCLVTESLVCEVVSTCAATLCLVHGCYEHEGGGDHLSKNRRRCSVVRGHVEFMRDVTY
jgi:hypothetical protein